MTAPWYRKPLCATSLCHTFCFTSDESGCWGECSICQKRVGYVGRAVLREMADAQAIEARRAETGTGSVHESAVPQECAKGGPDASGN